MLRNHWQQLLLLVLLLRNRSFASGQNQVEPACHNAQPVLYQGYDGQSRYPLKLSYDPVTMGLCLQRMGAGNDKLNRFISLPEPLAAIDVAVTTGQQTIVAGTSHDNRSFLQAIDDKGNLLWRYPSSVQMDNHPLQLYDLALDKNKTSLFAAGSKEGQSMLWYFSLSASGIRHVQEICPPSGSTTGSYRQVITGSGYEVIAAWHSDREDFPSGLEKWYRKNDQWHRIPDFCPELSLSNVISTALIIEPAGKQFYLIVSGPGRVHFLQIDSLTGDILNQLTADSLFLQWHYTARITTPVLLSASSALGPEPAGRLQRFEDLLARLGEGLTSHPVLVLMNRGCLLGISSSFTRNTPLVINLCPEKKTFADRPEPACTRATRQQGVVSSYRLIIRSIFIASGILGLPVLSMKVARLIHGLLIRQPVPPRDNRKESIRRKRLEYLAKNLAFPEPPGQSPGQAENQRRFYNPSNELFLQDMSVKNQQPQTDEDHKEYFQLLLEELKSKASEQTPSAGAISREMLSRALATVMSSWPSTAETTAEMSASHDPERIPDALTLLPMPRDHLCFYHALGQAENISGQQLFDAIIFLARVILQYSPELAEHINNLSGGNILEEIVAMGNMETGVGIWGHQEMLPFISWYLQLPVVIVTPATWHNEAGSLFFMPDGHWEMLNGDSKSILSKLRGLKNAWPGLLIMQHDGANHWDVLEWTE